MTAVQLLEKLGADASLKEVASEDFYKAFPTERENVKQSKIWCALMPEKEDEESEDPDEEEKICH